MEDLIPGLPKEIGLECLIRVPPETLPLLRQVCRRWKQATESSLFHHLRRSAGSSHHLIIFLEARPAPCTVARRSLRFFSSYPFCRFTALNQTTGEWTPLPQIPFVPPFFFDVVTSGLHLVVIGGWDPDSLNYNDGVYIYSFLSGTWHRGRPMPGPTRFLFACAGSPCNQIFVAGGHDEQMNALKSAMVYDITKDNWMMLLEMEREREDCTGAFEAGLFWVVGGSKKERFEWSTEAFDVGEWRWREVEEEAVQEEEFSKTFVMGGDGRIYKCGGGEKMLLVKEEGEWREVAKLPEDVGGSPIMVAWGKRLMVVRVESCDWPSSMFVLEMKQGVAIGWRKVAFPRKYHGCIYTACVDI